MFSITDFTIGWFHWPRTQVQVMPPLQISNTHKTFHILEMKAHFVKEPHFENRNMFLEK